MMANMHCLALHASHSSRTHTERHGHAEVDGLRARTDALGQRTRAPAGLGRLSAATDRRAQRSLQGARAL